MERSHQSLNKSIEYVKKGIRGLRQDKTEGKTREADISVRYADSVKRIKELEDEINGYKRKEMKKEEEQGVIIEELKKVKVDNESLRSKLLLLEKERELSNEAMKTSQTKEETMAKVNAELRDETHDLRVKIQEIDSLKRDLQDRLQLKEHEVVTFVKDRKKTTSQLQAYIDDLTDKWQASLTCCENLTEQLKQELESRKQLREQVDLYKDELIAVKVEKKSMRTQLKQMQKNNSTLTLKEREVGELSLALDNAKEDILSLQTQYNIVVTELEKSKNCLQSVEEERQDVFTVAEQLKSHLTEAERSRDHHKLQVQMLSSEVFKCKETVRDMEYKMKVLADNHKNTLNHVRLTVTKLEDEAEKLREEMRSKDKEIGRLKQDSLARELQVGEFQRAEIQRNALLQMKKDVEANLLHENQELQGKVALLQIYKNLEDGKVKRPSYANDGYDTEIEGSVRSLCLPGIQTWHSDHNL